MKKPDDKRDHLDLILELKEQLAKKSPIDENTSGFTFEIYNTMTLGENLRFPDRIICKGCSLRQALELAKWLNTFYTSQVFLVEGFEDTILS